MTEAREFTTRDYRLFDVQHAVLPTKLPLKEFYRQLVLTQQVLRRKYMGWHAFLDAGSLALRFLMRGQTNFVRMLWKFDKVYNAERQAAEHRRHVKYEMKLPARPPASRLDRSKLFIHPQQLLKPIEGVETRT